MPDLDTEQRSSRRLWIFAALAALALHLGGAALAFAHLHADDLDESLGTPAIEIGLEMTSPHLEPTDLPPGPDAEASVASPAIAEQKAELKDSELPKDVPTETEDPDRVVTPNDSNKPRKKSQSSLPCRPPPPLNRLPPKPWRRRASMRCRRAVSRLRCRAPEKRCSA